LRGNNKVESENSDPDADDLFGNDSGSEEEDSDLFEEPKEA